MKRVLASPAGIKSRFFGVRKSRVNGELCPEVAAHVMVIDKKRKRGVTEIQRPMGKEVASPPVPKEVMALLGDKTLIFEGTLFRTE